jgi:hypothetical protein
MSEAAATGGRVEWTVHDEINLIAFRTADAEAHRVVPRAVVHQHSLALRAFPAAVKDIGNTWMS